MDDLLTPMEKIMKLMCEESFREDDLQFIERIKNFEPHVCSFKDSGVVSYVSPLEYEQKCECGDIRWRI
jgi:hypothetical protein